MTSLIDVIFLLLLFFMLTSTFTRFGEVPLLQAGRSAETEVPESVLRVFVRLSPEGATLNGQPVEPGRIDVAMREALGELRTRQGEVADPSSGPSTGTETALAFLSVAPDVKSQDFIQVFARLQALPDLTLSVLQ